MVYTMLTHILFNPNHRHFDWIVFLICDQLEPHTISVLITQSPELLVKFPTTLSIYVKKTIIYQQINFKH
jgi:hypothetical protein